MVCRIAALSLLCLTTLPSVAGARKISKLAEVPTGWKQPVRAVAIDARGELLVAGGDAKQLLLYSLAKRRTLWIGGTRDRVLTLAFSPDGKTIAVGGRGRAVELLATATGKVRRRLSGLRGIPRSLAFAPDGKLLAVAGQSQQIMLFDPATGKAKGLLHGHTSWVASVVFSPDGKLVAGGGWDHAVRIWDVARRKLLRSAHGHRYAVNAVVFTQNGQELVSASDDQHLRLVKASSAALVSDRRSPSVVCLARSVKRNVLVGGTFGGKLLVMRQDKLVATDTVKAHRGRIYGVAITPDGRVVASGGRDGRLRLWQVR